MTRHSFDVRCSTGKIGFSVTAILSLGLLGAAVSASPGGADDPPAGDLSLTAQVLDVDGGPVRRTSITFYREVTAGEAPQKSDVHDLATGRSWRYVKGAATGSQMTATKLPKGTYRVLARRGHYEATPLGSSDPIVLDGSQEEPSVTVRLATGASILARAADDASGAAVPSVSVKLKRDDWPAISSSKRPAERQDFVVFDHLPPGRYTLSASHTAPSPNDLQYTLDEPQVIELAETNQQIVLRLHGRRMSDSQIAQRWPWYVTGRVTDPQGKPIAGATVHVATGHGTLIGGARTTTDAGGSYKLRFGQGGMIFGEQKSNDPVSLQAALFFAGKPGMAEANLNRQGNMMMALRQPPPGQIPGDKTVILPGSPRQIDFVLVPAASLKVEMVGPGGQRLVPQSLSIVGVELPPGSNELNQVQPEWNGEFRFADVPIGRAWRLATRISGKRELTTDAFTLNEASEYRLKVRFNEANENQLESLDVESIGEPAIEMAE